MFDLDPVDYSARPLRVMFICTGNICRSPLAEGLFRTLMEGTPVAVSSAGTRAVVGHHIDPRTIHVAAELGLNLEGKHQARQLDTVEMSRCDLIVTMTREHRRLVVERLPSVVRKTFTLKEIQLIVQNMDLGRDEVFRSANPSGRMRERVNTLAKLRGSIGQTLGAQDLDILDPYGRGAKVHKVSILDIDSGVRDLAGTLSAASG